MASAQGAATFSVVAKDAASSVLRGVGKEMGKLGKTGGAVFKTLAATAAAVGAAISAAAFASLKFTKMAITAAVQDDAEQQKLIATLKARGLTTEQATQRVNELIAAGQKLAFTDSETRAGINIASQYTKNYAKQTAILTAAQNLARARNISLEAATKLVGKAYNGNGAALKAYGVDLKKTITTVKEKNATDKEGNLIIDRQVSQTTEVIKGMEAVRLITDKNAGVAEAYAKTFSGQFDQVRDSINETIEAIGYAIGGGEGLPTFTRLLEGIRPVLDDVLGEINKNLPNIQRFSRELVEKFLAKLPGYVATAKRELPILIDKAKEFIGSVAGFGKDIASFLGPDGLVTAGIAGLGFKMGGLGGAAGSVFASEFIKLGVDPITASILGTIGGAVTKSIADGLTNALISTAMTKFLNAFKGIPVSPSIPTTVPGVTPTGVPVQGGGGPAGFIGNILKSLGIAAAGVGVAEVKRQVDFRFQDLSKNILTDVFGKDLGGTLSSGLEGLMKITTKAGPFSAAIDTLNRLDPGGKKDVLGAGGFFDSLLPAVKNGVTEGLQPLASTLGRDVNFTNSTTITLDGAVVAKSVNRYLGLTTSTSNGTRNGGR